MKKLLTRSMAIGLLFTAASCTSASKSSSTTAARTAASSAVSTAGSSPTGDSTTAGGGLDTSGLDDVHAQVYTMGLDVAAAKGVPIDAACVKAVIAQLSAADAKLIVDAGPEGSPKLSAAGQAVGAKLGKCTIAPPS